MVWLPRRNDDTLTQAHHPYVVVGAIAHQGDHNSGHLRAIGRGAAGWVTFNDMQEAQLVGADPPMTNQWVCIFLIREDAVDLSLWSHHVVGLDDRCRQLVALHHTHGKQFQQYPSAVKQWLATHCCLCGKLVISHTALTRHVKNRHSRYRQLLQDDWDEQNRRWVSSLPCAACEARPILGYEPLRLDHLCQPELNLRLGLHYHQEELLPRGAYFAVAPNAVPLAAAPDEPESLDVEGLGAWLFFLMFSLLGC